MLGRTGVRGWEERVGLNFAFWNLLSCVLLCSVLVSASFPHHSAALGLHAGERSTCSHTHLAI